MKRMIAVVLALTLLLGGVRGVTAMEMEQVTSDTLYVQQVEGMGEDFILGADVSSLLAEEASGVVYRDFDGRPRTCLKC